MRRLRAAIDNAEEENDTFTAMVCFAMSLLLLPCCRPTTLAHNNQTLPSDAQVMTGQLDIETAKLEAAKASQNVYNLTFGVVKTGLDVIATPRE